MKTLAAILLCGACLSSVAAHAEETQQTPGTYVQARPVIVSMDKAEAQELLTVLNAAIKATGYSRTSVAALQFGDKLERAVAEAAKPPVAPTARPAGTPGVKNPEKVPEKVPETIPGQPDGSEHRPTGDEAK